MLTDGVWQFLSTAAVTLIIDTHREQTSEAQAVLNFLKSEGGTTICCSTLYETDCPVCRLDQVRSPIPRTRPVTIATLLTLCFTATSSLLASMGKSSMLVVVARLVHKMTNLFPMQMGDLLRRCQHVLRTCWDQRRNRQHDNSYVPVSFLRLIVVGVALTRCLQVREDLSQLGRASPVSLPHLRLFIIWSLYCSVGQVMVRACVLQCACTIILLATCRPPSTFADTRRWTPFTSCLRAVCGQG